jgi:hypothetical protein
MTNQELLTAFDRTNRQVFAAGATRVWEDEQFYPCPILAVGIDAKRSCWGMMDTLHYLDMDYDTITGIIRDYDKATGDYRHLVSRATAREALVSALS